MFTHAKRRIGAALGSLALVAGFATAPTQSSAQDFWIGQIIPVGFTFCPRLTAEANGQLLPISQNQALFSLYGTTYGGDGRTTFGLPDLRGRSPIHVGTGPGLPSVVLGQRGGAATHTLNVNEMPAHTHRLNTVQEAADKNRPNSDYLAASPTAMYHDGPPTGSLDAGAVSSTGGSQPFSIQDPFLTIRYCVALQGIFPSRS